MKLNQDQEKQPWDLDSALAYIEGDQQSLSNGKGKKKVNKLVAQSTSNNTSLSTTSKSVNNPENGGKDLQTTQLKTEVALMKIQKEREIQLKKELKEIQLKKEILALKKEVENLQARLVAEESTRAKIASNFQNIKIEVASLKDSKQGLEAELKASQSSLQQSQKELEQTKTLLNKEQNLRRQAEANGKSEMTTMTSKQRELQMQVQEMLKGQERLKAAFALETNRRILLEQELKRIKVAAEADKKNAASSRNPAKQVNMLERQKPTVVRQLGDQKHQLGDAQLQRTLASSHSVGQVVDNQLQMDQYLREEQEQMENFRKLKQLKASGPVPLNGLIGPYHPHPHTPTLVEQTMKPGQVKGPRPHFQQFQDRLFGKSAAHVETIQGPKTAVLPNHSKGQTTSAHTRLVERLRERGNLVPIAPSECSRLVIQVQRLKSLKNYPMSYFCCSCGQAEEDCQD